MSLSLESSPLALVPVTRPRIAVTDIGEYIRHHSCERRFKLKISKREVERQVPFMGRTENSLDLVLMMAGVQHEDDWADELVAAGVAHLGAHLLQDDPLEWDDFLSLAASHDPSIPAFARQVKVLANIGRFDIGGNIDFVLLLPGESGEPARIRLVECKASRRDHTYHHVQVGLYRMMIGEMLRQAPVTLHGSPVAVDQIECVVARVDEESNQRQAILSLPSLDLSAIEADLRGLLADTGTLARVADTDLDSLAYQIDAKCDDCVFNINCLPESARQRRLELIGVDPSTARALRACDVTTIDDLASIDPEGDTALRVRGIPGFGGNLEQLRQLARARSKTLPGGLADPELFEVEALPFAWQSQLPNHQITFRMTNADEVAQGAEPREWEETQRLVRVYLEVNYDYVENRIGALAAHVTDSEGQIFTGFRDVDGRPAPDPSIYERFVTGEDADGKPTHELETLASHDVIAIQPDPWTGNMARDTEAERVLIERFFRALTREIRRVAGDGLVEAPVHFYVWTANEMSRLVEGCDRAGGGLLGHLRELLGCRAGLEQLIFSVLEEEVDRRYALGWTGRGLSVVSSLRWYGRRFHWLREVDGVPVELDRVFEQDIFDFKSTLRYEKGMWADPEDESVRRHLFEIRSRFRDTLKAPYWRAHWGTLTASAGAKHQERQAVERYNQAGQPGMLQAYLSGRVQAIRWVEENIRYKNDEIFKPRLNLLEIEQFTLGVNDVRRSAIDFLQLDQHVKLRNWIGANLLPPASRVPKGRTIPLSRVEPVEGTSNRFVGWIDLDGYALSLDDLAGICSYGPGDFVRLTPHWGSPNESQRIGAFLWRGSTCTIVELDWETGRVELDVLPMKSSLYHLGSWGRGDWPDDSKPSKGGVRSIPHATLDESPSEFVGNRVERRLNAGLGHHVDAWLDPLDPRTPPQVPLSSHERQRLRELLESIRIGVGDPYDVSQIDAVLDGLDSRIQALQGPPGTGKTTTTALAILTRILARREPEDIVAIAANTHTAVDTLLRAIVNLLPAFRSKATSLGFQLPEINLGRIDGEEHWSSTGVEVIDGDKPIRQVEALIKDAVLIVAGTTGATLKLAANLNERARFKRLPQGFQTPLLIVDEASMMVFPHFLALATLVREDGEIMLAGDQRQLSPIVAHDWQNEDRLPVTLYQPHMSAIEAVQNLALKLPETAVRKSSLSVTFRLPTLVRELVARLYRLDEIELTGPDRAYHPSPRSADGWGWIWEQQTGIFLVLHDERESKQSNEVESELIRAILEAGGNLVPGTVGLVTPHRAQRALLRKRLDAFVGDAVDVVDTVEKLQGNERRTIIVSGTASDTAVISSTAEFILGLNRSNVAFSRAQDRLIVVCSETLLNHIAADLEHYQAAMLWKALREVCDHCVVETVVDGHRVRVMVPVRE